LPHTWHGIAVGLELDRPDRGLDALPRFVVAGGAREHLDQVPDALSLPAGTG
jgi:hypothetical protein